MNIKENKDSSCDIETGICSTDNKGTNQQQKEETNAEELSKVKLVYYYDALCGWCYGFSSVMSKVNKAYADKLKIEVVSGGLFLGNRIGFVNEVAPYIREGAYRNVEDRTGAKFGKPFLECLLGEGKLVLNSLPLAIALCIVKEKFPEKQFEFAELLLHAVYFDGMNPINFGEYIEYVEKVGVNKDEFFNKMKDNKYRVLAEKEFEKFRSSRFSGMPALILETEDKQITLTNGYTDFENIKLQLDKLC